MASPGENGFLRRLIFVALLALLVPGNSHVLAAEGETNGALKLTLVYSLSTNAVAHAAGHNPDNDMRALANWRYGDYNKTNLALLTNAVWATNFWLYGVRGLSSTCIRFSNGLGGQGL